jgi:hypothetical protein
MCPLIASPRRAGGTELSPMSQAGVPPSVPLAERKGAFQRIARNRAGSPSLEQPGPREYAHVINGSPEECLSLLPDLTLF